MRVLKNPIFIIALIAIAAASYYWQFRVRPVSDGLYNAALNAYNDHDFKGSVQLLEKAYRINPLDPATLRLLGWNYLNLGKPAEARRYFGRARLFGPKNKETLLGLAYSHLELDDNPRALEYFHRLPENLRGSPLVQVAMARAYRGVGENETALGLVEGILRQDPQDKLALKELAYLTGVDNLESLAVSESPLPARSPSLVVAARLHEGYFQIPEGGEWKTIYIAGVNIGPAAPGHFPSDPPVEMSVYLAWLNQIGAMGANCVRVYTLLPPGFYRALLTYNLQNPPSPLYLFQEIWLKEPPLDNLCDQAFTAEFEKELRNIVDAIHGQASLPILKGYAGGIYSADVSPYVLGWLVGREIEPHEVITTNLRNPGVNKYEGRYLKIENGNPSEVWLTGICDRLVEYEVNRYNWQRPVCFVNWLTLDPLTHPTETRIFDENKFFRQAGEEVAPLGLGVQDDSDVVSLDEEKIMPQPEFQAGYFALYHIYPYWPDFILLDPGYRTAKDSQGLNNYWGYLLDLKRHFRRTPLLVGEYGLSTSIGIAHFNPNGWNHGGLNEAQQGETLVRLTDNIQKAGYAGGLIFEWLDEWWKVSWLVQDFEKPFDRKAFWHNDLNPEQFFGLVRFVPQAPLSYATVATAQTPLGHSPDQPGATTPPWVRSIQAAWDPSALYIDLVLDVVPGSPLDWSRHRYVLGLNTCDAPCGSAALPFVNAWRIKNGANFVVYLGGPDSSRLMIAHSYNPFLRRVSVEGRPALMRFGISGRLNTTLEPQGQFEGLLVQPNSPRFGRDGTFYPGIKYDRGLLRYGTFDPDAQNYDSLGQWYFDQASGRIRLRLSWGLLLALDPSEGLIFWGTDEHARTFGKVSSRIQLALLAYPENEGGRSGVPTQVMARQVMGNLITEAWSMAWPTWSSVQCKPELKQSYGIVARALARLTGRPSQAGGR